MKNVFIFIGIIFLQSAFGQTSRNLGDFDKVKAFDRINVELIPSDENKIEITGKRSDEVEIINNNGEIKIRMKLATLLDGEDINAKLYFRELKSIDAAEGSFIGCADTFKQRTIELTAKEGAQIKVNIDVESTNVKSVTGGIIKVSGIAERMDANIGTGGILEAKDLITAHTEVDIKAGGEADVNATEHVDADVKAGGTITIYGSPKQIDKKTTLGGTIRER